MADFDLLTGLAKEVTLAEIRDLVSALNASSNSDWNTIFEHNIPPGGSLPSGSAVVVDPVLNTEPNVIDSGWIRAGLDNDAGDEIEQWANQRLTVGGDVALQVFVMNANDELGTGIRNDGFPFMFVSANETRSIGARFFGKYYRVLVQNTSGSTLTEVNINSQGGTADASGLTLSLDQPLFDQVPALTVRSVPVGRQPDGDYVNTPADGNLVNYTTPLGAGASVVLGPYDTDGWKSIELYVATDQVSASQGIVVEYTPDAQATTPVWYPGPKFTFGADAVASGFLLKPFAPAMDGFRLTYTNGGVPQSTGLISLEVKNSIVQPSGVSIENDIDPAATALLTRGAVFAEDEDVPGAYNNVKAKNDGLKISIANQEVELEQKALGSFKVTRASVTITPTLLFTPSANCRSWVAKGTTSGGKIIYIAENLAKATPSSGFPLDDKEWVGGDLFQGGVYGSCDAGTQSLSIFEVLK